MRNKYKKKLVQFIGIILFVIILFKIDIIKSLEILCGADIRLVILAIIMIFPIIGLKTSRWYYLLRLQNIRDLSFRDSFLIYFVGIFWSNITPGKLGGFSKVLYLKEKKYSLGKSLYSVLFDYFFDLLSVIILGISGMFLFFSIFQQTILYISIILGSLFFLFLIYLYKKHHFNNFLKKIFYFLIPSHYHNQTDVNLNDFKIALKSLSPGKFFIGLILSLIIWLIYLLQIYIVAIAIGINLSFLYNSVAIAISSFLSLLPITISGIGTRDLVLITLFSQFGITQEKAIALSLSVLFLIFLNVLFGWIVSLIKPLKFTSSQKSTSNES